MEEHKDGGNSKPEGQPQEVAEEKINVLTIDIGKVSKRVEVTGLLGNKPLCYHAIAEAIKSITDFNPSPIVRPVGGMAGLARKFFKR